MPAGSVPRPVEGRRESFEASVREILADREVVRAGRMQILTMDAVKQRLGGDWLKFAEKVREATHAVMKRELARQDTFIEAAECCFIIVFAHLDGERARFRALSLMQQVIARLFGEEAATDPSFRDLIGAHAVHLDLDRSALGSSGSVFDWLNRNFDAAAGEPAGDRSEEGGEVGEGGSELDYDRYFSWAEGLDQSVQPDRIVWQFKPLWDVPRRALTTYVCAVAEARSKTGRSVDTRWIYAQAEDPRIGHLDAQMLSRVAQELHEVAGGRHPCLIGCQVHYYTLDTKARRQAYLRQFRHLPEDHRRFLCLTVCNLPPGIPAGRAQQLVADLRPHARLVVLRLNLMGVFEARLRAESLRVFREAGFDAVGFDMSDLHRGEPAILKLLDEFAAAASAAGLRPYIIGLRNTSTTLAAFAAGYEFINSDAISPAVERPSYMFRFRFEDMFGGTTGSRD